jgi:hypothetical protein
VTHDREGHTIEVGGLAIRLQGLAAPERDGRVPPRQPKLRVPSCSVAAYAASSAVTARTTGAWQSRYLQAEDIAEVMVHQGLARDCPMVAIDQPRSMPPRMALTLARITSCRSIADCDRLAWQAPGRSTGLLHYPAQRRPILEVLSRIEGEQLLEQPVGGSQLNHGAPGLASTDDIAAVEQMVEQRSA